MAVSGFVVLSFIVCLGSFYMEIDSPEFQQLGPFDAYTMLVASFQNLPLALLYVVSVALIGVLVSRDIKCVPYARA